MFWGIVTGWFALQIIVFLFLVWISWKYFDKRYKKKTERKPSLYNGSLVRTEEVFIDPQDGLKYRVYFNPHTGEREYFQED